MSNQQQSFCLGHLEFFATGFVWLCVKQMDGQMPCVLLINMCDGRGTVLSR